MRRSAPNNSFNPSATSGGGLIQALGAAMSNPASAAKVVESFDSWDTPWEFFTSVSASQALNDEDRRLLEEAWASACNRSIWISTDNLASGVVAAETALSESFPWLSPLACQQLARAAAYQWR